MAEKKVNAKSKTKAPKKVQTVRERTESSANQKRRIRKTVSKVSKPVKSVKKINEKQYHIPLPDSKLGRFLRRRVRFVPKFVREAFQEVKLVTWPNRKETVRMTFAVFVFAVFIAAFVGALDYGLSNAFEKFILNKN